MALLEARAEEFPSALSILGKVWGSWVALLPFWTSPNQRKETFWIFFDLQVLCFLVVCCASPPSGVVGELSSRPLCRRLWERPRPHLSPVTNQWQPSESWPPGSPLGPALEQWEASLADKWLLPALTCCLKSNRGNPFIPYSSGPLPSQFVLGKVAVGGRGAPGEGGEREWGSIWVCSGFSVSLSQ